MLMTYTFEIKYRKIADHANADALSRLPLSTDESLDKDEESCFQISFDDIPIKAGIQKYSKSEKTIADRLSSERPAIKPFFNRFRESNFKDAL